MEVRSKIGIQVKANPPDPDVTSMDTLWTVAFKWSVFKRTKKFGPILALSGLILYTRSSYTVHLMSPRVNFAESHKIAADVSKLLSLILERHFDSSANRP
jgi:hypothetical protein